MIVTYETFQALAKRDAEAKQTEIPFTWRGYTAVAIPSETRNMVYMKRVSQ